MKLLRWTAVLLVLAMLTGFAAAEEITSEPALLYAPAEITPEEVGAFVEAMFAAATGTTVQQERELRKEMTDEEAQARNAAGVDYRARTIPWLIAAFGPEILQEESAQTEPTPQPTEAPADALPVYTVQDSYEAFTQTESGAEYLALLESMGGNSPELSLRIAREICGLWMAQVNPEKLSAMNEDYRCWIYAPATQIDYPVVQGEDNSRYLKRLFNGERNAAGTLFIDYRNLPDFQDPNTLIYGHHMRNDSMFGTLTDYADQAYFEAHPFMLIMTPEEVFLLEIFAGYTTSDQDHCYDIAISDEDDMTAFIGEAVRKSDFISGVPVKTTDKQVTLSTCAYAFEDARYILIGRIIPMGWNFQR